MKIEQRFHGNSQSLSLFTKLRASNPEITKSHLSKHLNPNGSFRGGFLNRHQLESNRHITIGKYQTLHWLSG